VFIPASGHVVVRQKVEPIQDTTDLINCINKIAKDQQTSSPKFDTVSNTSDSDSSSSSNSTERASLSSNSVKAVNHNSKSASLIASYTQQLSQVDDTNFEVFLNSLITNTDLEGEDPILSAITRGNLSAPEAYRLWPTEIVDAAIHNELSNMDKQQTWTVVSTAEAAEHQRTTGHRIITSKMFIKEKWKGANFDKLKCRIVAGGHQQHSDSYSDVSAPTVDMSSVYLLLSMNKYLQGNISSVDIPMAYLNAPLKETIYMRLTKEISKLYLQKHPEFAKFVDIKGCLVVKLLKCLYGLKQSGLEWNDELTSTLKNQGNLSQSIGDACFFYHVTNDKKYIFLVKHVDDILVSTNNEPLRTQVSQALSKYGQLSWEHGSFTYLGMQLEQLEDRSIKVSLGSMTNNIMERRGITSSSTCPSNQLLFTNKDDPSQDYSSNSTDFKSQTYELMFLDRVRIDIKKECGVLASASNNPGPIAYQMLNKVQRYLHGTKDAFIILGCSNIQLNVYVDAAYAVHPDSKSHTGIYVTLGKNGGPILVKSYKQRMVTTSSTEAELLALVDGVKKSLPLLKILGDIGFKAHMKVWQDNQSTIQIANKGEGFGTKAKHFRVRHDFLKDLIKEATISLEYCNSQDMLADYLTKPMAGTDFHRQVSRAMVNKDKHT
jgi:hypothetical protein